MSYVTAGHGTFRRKAVWGGAIRAALAASIVAVSSGCGDLVREGGGSGYLIVTSLEAASGATPQAFGGTLNSDVLTFVDGFPTIFNDVARVSLQLAMKDTLTSPTTNNFITINRYRVRYIRADGRNTPGVDVPSGFDGALTVTVGGAPTTVGFELVRHIAKEQAPLQSLARNFAVIISTIAEVTFYGHDQTGREASVTAQLLVNFGDFGDPN
jgi:hypothetical protein